MESAAGQRMAAIAKQLGLKKGKGHLPDLSDRKVVIAINRDIATRCRPVFDAWARAEAASRAHAREIQPCPCCIRWMR